MTTYIKSGFAVFQDNQGNVSALQPTELRVVVEDALTVLNYRIETAPPAGVEGVPDIVFEDTGDILGVYIDEEDVDQVSYYDYPFIFRIVGDSTETGAFGWFNEASNASHLFQLIGDQVIQAGPLDQVPTPRSDDWLFEAYPDGPYAPGTDFAIAGLLWDSVTEDDRLLGTPQNDSYAGGLGNDTLDGAEANDVLDGGAGDDSLSGGDGFDRLIGGPGNDTLRGGADTDTVVFNFASTGFTSRSVTGGWEVTSAEGTDFVASDIEQVEFTDVTQGSGVLSGQGGGAVELSEQNDSFAGNGAGQLIRALGGDDIITPGLGSDTVDGGPGVDAVTFVDHPAGVIADLSLDPATARSGADTNVLIDVENITGSVFGDYIRGDAADNRIRALGDYDWLVGSGGADYFDGGTGRDMISYAFAGAGVTVDLAAGRGRAGQADGDRYVSIERVTGSIHNDLIYGDDGDNDFRGLGGYDWFVGSGGRDRYDGGSGLDMVSYALSDAGVVASLLLGRGSGGDAARDLYTSIERLTGSSFDDVLTGDNGRNELRGLYGEDRIFGNGGVDYITGGGSDDYIDGGSGWDVAVYQHNRADYGISRFGDGTVSVRYVHGAGEGTDTLVNIEALQFADDLFYL